MGEGYVLLFVTTVVLVVAGGVLVLGTHLARGAAALVRVVRSVRAGGRVRPGDLAPAALLTVSAAGFVVFGGTVFAQVLGAGVFAIGALSTLQQVAAAAAVSEPVGPPAGQRR